MPQFFFDYRDERGNLQQDTDGIDLPDADAAYLEAYRPPLTFGPKHVARVEILDMGGLRSGMDPAT